MAELTVDDLIAYSGDRLADTDETQRVLDAAQAFVRNYCGWHVSPVRENDELVVDGSNARVLNLPTKKMLALHSIVEDGVTVFSDSEGSITVEPYWSVLGAVSKIGAGRWTWKPRAVTVEIDHGYTESEAADWRGCVLGVANRASLSVAGQFSSMSAGPFSVTLGSAELLLPSDTTILDRYTLLGSFA